MFMTGCLYFSTNSSKASISPCLTRNIKAASGSLNLPVTKITLIQNRPTHKVAHRIVLVLVLRPRSRPLSWIEHEDEGRARFSNSHEDPRHRHRRHPLETACHRA